MHARSFVMIKVRYDYKFDDFHPVYRLRNRHIISIPTSEDPEYLNPLMNYFLDISKNYRQTDC